MKSILTAAALLAATASADLCAHGSTDDNGNFYCQQVQAITYTGVGSSGSYNKVTSMGSGGCGSTPQAYSGSLAPLDEEVSMHFRGPLQLKQFAFYAPASSSSSGAKAKRDIHARVSAHERRHAHGHGHAHLHEKRALGAEVTATIDGEVVSWANEYAGAAAATATAAAANVGSSGSSSSAAAANVGSSGSSSSAAASAAASAGSSSSSSSSSSNVGDGEGWTRQAYYNAQAQTAQGLVFLNHQGGSGSGVFDYTYGNSLSYSSADGTKGSASPQTLADTELPSNTEVVVMSDNKCTGDSCGFSREGTVAYHGFEGAEKAFFFEFEMPDDGQTSSSEYNPVNMPAIWLLNAQIPRTLQYGNAQCSCWQSGCGEFDIFEVLAPGDSRAKSTLHGNLAGGDSDYFLRPTNGTIKAALLLYNNNIHIKILPDFAFGPTMGSAFVREISTDTLVQQLGLVSLFSLGGSS